MTRRYARISSLLIWLLLISTGAYASAQIDRTAQRSATDPNGGTIGFSAVSIRYTLNPANPSQIARVVFTLAPHSPGTQAAMVRVKLIGASSNYFPCTNVPPASASWECPVNGVAVATADQLTLDVDGSAAIRNHVLWLPLMPNHR